MDVRIAVELSGFYSSKESPPKGRGHPIGVRHYCILLGGEGMGLFEKTHLSDKNPAALCRGPSRGLRVC